MDKKNPFLIYLKIIFDKIKSAYVIFLITLKPSLSHIKTITILVRLKIIKF